MYLRPDCFCCMPTTIVLSGKIVWKEKMLDNFPKKRKKERKKLENTETSDVLLYGYSLNAIIISFLYRGLKFFPKKEKKKERNLKIQKHLMFCFMGIP